MSFRWEAFGKQAFAIVWADDIGDATEHAEALIGPVHLITLMRIDRDRRDAWFRKRYPPTAADLLRRARRLAD